MGVRERKRLENYETEKMGLLYKVILEDNGVPNLLKLITQLNEKAKRDVEEEEKRRKRRMAISEASNGDGQSSISKSCMSSMRSGFKKGE